MADILDDKPDNTQFGGDTGTDADYKYEHDQINEVAPDEYQSKCEILMDLCLKHFDRHRAMLFDDYNNLMTQAQEEYDNQTTEG